MAVNLSPVGGVAAQFFTSTGAVLTGGKLYTYAAGTTTPAVTYTSSNGLTAWTNPVVLDAAGRVPGSGEIWLTDGLIYKFVLKDANDVLIATYDNITGINSNAVAYTNQQEIVTATAGQTVFDLGISYQPGTNSLSVFVDGVNQYGPGAQYSYVETDSNTVTFNNGLHVGAEVKFTTTQQQGAGAVDASQVTFTGFNGTVGNVQNLADNDGSDWIGFEQAGAGAIAISAQDKMRQIVSVLDFGAYSDGTHTAETTAAFNAAIAASNCVYIPQGTYSITSLSINKTNFYMFGCGDASVLQLTAAANVGISIGDVSSTENVTLRQFRIQGNASNQGGIQLGTATNYVAYVLLDELTIRDIRNTVLPTPCFGLRLRSVQELEVRNCRFINNFYNVYRNNEGYLTATLFCGKKSYCGLGGVGFYVNGNYEDLTIRDYIFESNSTEGISFDYYRGNATISDCYFEENCFSGSGNGHIYVTGNTATAYQYATVNIERCAFHIMTQGLFPNVKLGATRALLTGNFGMLGVNQGVVTTANTSATFIQNKTEGADNPIAIYRALLGNVSALDTDENGVQFALAKNMAYVAQTPTSGTPNNVTYVSIADGKLYFRDGSGVDHALY